VLDEFPVLGRLDFFESALAFMPGTHSAPRGLEILLPVGVAFTTRYFAPDRFVMTSGGGVPFDDDLLETVVDSTPLLLRESPAEAISKSNGLSGNGPTQPTLGTAGRSSLYP
jgi:hypothetical protein